MSINQREEQEIFTSNKTSKKAMENLNELLLEKCEEGNLREVLALLDRGADINARNNYQNTPLHVACRYGKIEVMMVLLDRGADIHARDKYQCTPLHEACYYGKIEVMMALLDRGADIHARGIYLSLIHI